MAVTALAQAEARDLTVTSWGGAYQDAQRKVFFEPYTQETGIKLVEDSWDGGIGPLRAKTAGAPTWDLVQVEADELVLGCDEGIIEPIDFGKIGGEDAFLPQAVHECGVGAIVWGTVLAAGAIISIFSVTPSTPRQAPASALCAKARARRSSSR